MVKPVTFAISSTVKEEPKLNHGSGNRFNSFKYSKKLIITLADIHLTEMLLSEIIMILFTLIKLMLFRINRDFSWHLVGRDTMPWDHNDPVYPNSVNVILD